jgi:mRNA interferase MazF
MDHGSLKKESNIRPNRIFTADKNIILYKVGKITEAKFREVRDRIVEFLDK